jgi:class 3 adenylate cyclase/tetratricopeptide (TPR) repeat protein
MSAEDSRPREARKIVTVVFSDVTESTRLGGELDPESLRRVMTRYFETASEALERHGGTVEKFIGDAVMAVFGIPAVHEDDALRAVRAVAELHESIDGLNDRLEEELGVRIALRSGVNTGEVVAGDAAAGQTLVTGDAVNVAARLEQAADPGEILIGGPTLRLVRDAVRVEPKGKLELAGKADGVPSWRLVQVLEDVPAIPRRFESPLIGREAELAQLRHAFERAVSERIPYLFTLLGVAGIGKSRLAAELASAVSDSATVLVGRCLPYGDGITYWPLVEIVNELIGETDEPVLALKRLLDEEDGAELVAERIAGALGRSQTAASAEETFWAVRRLFEALARDRPLVLVLEDIHWGEPTLLDLIDHVADWSRDVPILLLCLARPDLFEKRPGWAGGKLNATSILLAPLDADESNALIDYLVGQADLPAATRARIAEAADGNPLYVEQMLAMLGEDGPAVEELEVPPTIQALLAARLDRLPTGERETLERASVVGRRFWTGAVVDLSPESARAGAPALLEELVRKDLVIPDRSVVPGEEGYRFLHQLIRDAAYAGIPKKVRADLHERFAAWIEQRAGERIVEVEEILGYHLEQSFRYRQELGPVDERGRRLAVRATERLSAAGRRALARGDASGAANLLGRAEAVLPLEASGREELLVELGSALVVAGRLGEARNVLTDAVEAAAEAGDRRLELHARLERAFLLALTDPAGVEELQQESEQALPELEALGDELGLAKAWRRIADVHWLRGRWDEQEQALERAIAHAGRAGDAREAAGALMRLPMAILYGPTPVPEAIRRGQEILQRGGDARIVRATALVGCAGLHGMAGRFETARENIARGRAIAEELGFRVWLAGFSLVAGDVEMLADDPATAEAELRRGFEALEGMGERGLLSRVAADLARALEAQGKHVDAEKLAGVSEELVASADAAARISLGSVRAQILAREGRLADAERRAREAVGGAERTDDLNAQGRVLVDLASVLERAGRPQEAVPVLERALEAFERKGNLVSAEKTRARLERLTPA